jgi:hypothetical protein
MVPFPGGSGQVPHNLWELGWNEFLENPVWV